MLIINAVEEISYFRRPREKKHPRTKTAWVLSNHLQLKKKIYLPPGLGISNAFPSESK